MSAPAIFVSHSHKDDAYCREFVARLRGAGLDVWYDEHNASAGHLVDLIERELRQRPIFVVVLSPAALESKWVKDECTWAYGRWQKDPANRVILPVLAETVDEDDIWLFLQAFKRVEQPGLRPWPVAEAARRVALAIDPNTPVMPVESQAAPSPAASHQSDEAEALIAAGNTLVSIGKRSDAIDLFRRATQTDPQSIAAWNALGYHLEYVGRHEEGLQAFEQTLRIDARNAFAWAGKAETLAWLGRPQEALPAAEMALRLDPNLAYAHNGKGAALHNLQRYDQALVLYDRALTLDSALTPAWNNRGYALLTLSRYQEALDAYNRAVTVDPSFTYAWNGKGFALYSLGRYEEALDAYDRAIAVDSTIAFAWVGQANTLRRLGRTREADEAQRRAKELEGKQ